MTPLVEMLIISAVKIGLALFIVLTAVAYLTYMERRVLGFIQKRLGPNRVGPFGLLQPLADGIKFIFKEDVIPNDVSRFLYILAPTVALIPALMTFAVIPVGENITLFGREIALHVSAVNVSVLFVFAMTSLGVYGIVLAGWSSNSKYSLFGGLRSSAQMVSYELALGLSIVGVLIQAGSLDLTQIVAAQAQPALPLAGATGADYFWHYFPAWFVIKGQPLGFLIFFIAVLAETNRVPFDLPEAETELVGGFHTEYSSMKFAMFFMAEYASMMTASCMATLLFFGGWQGPGIHFHPLFGPLLGVGYFVAKVFFFLFAYIWIRGTLPRFRFDQLMDFGWKLLLPLSIVNIAVTATVKLLISIYGGGR
jgi:NADH-quinone oxidoreductase subunit H